MAVAMLDMYMFVRCAQRSHKMGPGCTKSLECFWYAGYYLNFGMSLPTRSTAWWRARVWHVETAMLLSSVCLLGVQAVGNITTTPVAPCGAQIAVLLVSIQHYFLGKIA